MKFSLQLYGFFLSAYTAFSNSIYNSNTQISTPPSSPTSAEIKAARASQTVQNMKRLSKVLQEKELNKRISILKKDNGKYSTLSAKELKAPICWDSVFTIGTENEIRSVSQVIGLEDDFMVRLKVIITELHDEIHRCLAFGFADVLYSLEMLNILYFLKEICLEYHTEFGYEIVEMVIDCLYVHFLKSSGRKDGVTKQNTEERIIRIKEHDTELCEKIYANSKSFSILSRIIHDMPNCDSPAGYVWVLNMPGSAFRRNVIECNLAVLKDNNKQFLFKKLPNKTLSGKFEESINMEEIYKNLVDTRTNWKSSLYSSTECDYIVYLYLIAFSFAHCPQIRHIIYLRVNGAEQMRKFLLLNSNNCRFLSFLIGLLPSKYTDTLERWYRGDISASLMMCYKTILQVVDYQKYLLNETTKKMYISISDLQPEEKLRSILAVIYCYIAYLGDKIEVTGVIINYIKALNDISYIILGHLEEVDPVVFNDSIDKYVELCCAFKEFTSKIIEFDHGKEAPMCVVYSYLTEFYIGYHKTGLRIDGMYEISLTANKSHNVTVL